MKFLKKVWHWVRWPLLVLVVAYVALVIYRIPAAQDRLKSAQTVSYIEAQHITFADVMGTNLPPAPDEAQNNATVEGIDANYNGIRDDVELAIFKEYPNSAKIRAAELQYALAQQLYLTSVYDTDTWVAAAESDGRGYGCLSETSSRDNLEEHVRFTDALSTEVENFVFNTQSRKDAEQKVSTFTTSYTLPSNNLCDIDLNSLPN